MKRLKEYIITIGWSLKIALRVNAKIFIGWGAFSTLLAILPAVALNYNRQAISIISDYLLSGSGGFEDVLPSIIVLGAILTAIGLSKRINANFLYFVMYDAYYFGFEEYLMDFVQEIEIKTLMDKNYRNDHHTTMGRCGALADLMSSGCVFL